MNAYSQVIVAMSTLNVQTPMAVICVHVRQDTSAMDSNVQVCTGKAYFYFILFYLNIFIYFCEREKKDLLRFKPKEKKTKERAFKERKGFRRIGGGLSNLWHVDRETM